MLKLDESEIARAGIGRKFQKPTVFEELSVFENIELSLKGDKQWLAYATAARRLSWSGMLNDSTS